MDVGFVGLGLMGRAMARNLAKAGHKVKAWNRSHDAQAAADGLHMVANVDEAFQADAVLTMLSDDAAIRAVLLEPGVLQRARRGVVHVVTSTISLELAEALTAAHREAGIGYVAAPVFGRPDVAEAAQLNVVAAGDAAALARVQPLLDAIGRKTWVVGGEPRQANAVKVAGNMMIAMAIEAMAEATVLTAGHGVAPQAFIELITQTLFGGRVYENYGGKIVRGDYEAGFRMRLGLKDLNLAAAAAEEGAHRLPLLDAVRRHMADAVAAGLGEKDWAAMAEYTQGQSQHHP